LQFLAGLPDGLFSNQTHSFGTFWKAFKRKILKCFMSIWYTLWPCDLFYGIFCVHLLRNAHFGILDQGKSGNPVSLDLNYFRLKGKFSYTCNWHREGFQKKLRMQKVAASNLSENSARGKRHKLH
jgi:hypothetical protein